MAKWIILIIVFFLIPFTAFSQRRSRKEKELSKTPPSAASLKDSLLIDKKVEKEENPVIEGPFIQFEKESHDFQKIVQGDIVRYQFKFKNIGNKDLLIKDVKASCGCTVTQYPKTPIKPNQESSIDVSFNSAAKMGPQNKNLTVYTNMEPSLKILYLKAEVVSPSMPKYLQQKTN